MTIASRDGDGTAVIPAGVAVFFKDGALCWKSADGVVHRAATVGGKTMNAKITIEGQGAGGGGQKPDPADAQSLDADGQPYVRGALYALGRELAVCFSTNGYVGMRTSRASFGVSEPWRRIPIRELYCDAKAPGDSLSVRVCGMVVETTLHGVSPSLVAAIRQAHCDDYRSSKVRPSEKAMTEHERATLKDWPGYTREAVLAAAKEKPIAVPSPTPAKDSYVAKDADGKPMVRGAFYVCTTNQSIAGPYVGHSFMGSSVVRIGERDAIAHLLRRVPMTDVKQHDFGVRCTLRAGELSWTGRVGGEVFGFVLAALEEDRKTTAAQPAPSKPSVVNKPKPRCGQRWRLDGVELSIFDEAVTDEVYPSPIPDTWRARNWDGVRVEVRGSDLVERGEFIEGPTKAETYAEALCRIVELEAQNPPAGVSVDDWRKELVNAGSVSSRKSVTAVTLERARYLSNYHRKLHAEKWRKFGGGR